MKDELGRKIMTQFVGLRPKTCSCKMDNESSDKKAKGTKKGLIKQRLKFEDYKKCLQNNKIILESEQRFKSEVQNVFIEEVNKIALSINDNRRLQIFDGSYHIHPAQILEKYTKKNCYNI